MTTLESNVSSVTGGFPRVELEILRGQAKNKLRRIDVPVFLIGAAHDCDLVLADPTFPDVHTYLYVTKSGVSVRRLGEGPEMLVDGQAVQASSIRNGQMLRLGEYEFAVHVVPPNHLRNNKPQEHVSVSKEPALFTSDLPGVAEVRALLADIRSALKIESGLKLYVEPEAPWRTVTSHAGVSVRKATA